MHRYTRYILLVTSKKVRKPESNSGRCTHLSAPVSPVTYTSALFPLLNQEVKLLTLNISPGRSKTGRINPTTFFMGHKLHLSSFPSLPAKIRRDAGGVCLCVHSVIDKRAISAD